MTRQRAIQANLARRIEAKVYALGGYEKAAQTLGKKRNYVWRWAHPFCEDKRGKPYKARPPTLADLLWWCGWLGCSLGDLDPSRDPVTLGDVEDVIRRRDWPPDVERVVLGAVRAAEMAEQRMRRAG